MIAPNPLTPWSMVNPSAPPFPPVGECTGFCSGWLHDPSIMYRAETQTYYRFTTSNKITVSTAPAIQGPWTSQGAALPNGSIIEMPGSQDLWSPDVFQYNGTYYMAYAVSVVGSEVSDIGVATSKTMDAGEWTDHGSMNVPEDSYYNRIDPNFFQEDPSSPIYLSWGSFWHNIYQMELNAPPLTTNDKSPIYHLAQNTTVRPAPLLTGALEGSFRFQWNGHDYLFFSSGNCCNTPPNLAPVGEEYSIMVCRTSTPTEDFVDKEGKSCSTQNGGTLVLASHGDVYAPGGGGVWHDSNLPFPVLYYHYVQPSVSYEMDAFRFGWNNLDFSSGWPVAV